MSRATRRPILGLTRADQCSSAPIASSVATSDIQSSESTASRTPAVPATSAIVHSQVPDSRTNSHSDLQNLEWLKSKSDLYRFYSFTITFRDSSVGSNPSKFLSIYEGFVRRKMLEMIGYSYGDPVMFMREYSDVPTTANPNHPHHIHAVLGIPIPANHDRLLRKYKKLIARPQSKVIADVELRPLPTDEDVRRCYWYMRNHNINKKPFL